MKEKKMYFVTACISFTIVMLLSTVLFTFEYGEQVIDSIYVYQTFIVCCGVSGLIYITDHVIQDVSDRLKLIIRMFDMYFVVFATNIVVFKNYDLNIFKIIVNLVLLFITFASVYFLLFLKNKSDEVSINKKIQERNKKRG